MKPTKYKHYLNQLKKKKNPQSNIFLIQSRYTVAFRSQNINYSPTPNHPHYTPNGSPKYPRFPPLCPPLPPQDPPRHGTTDRARQKPSLRRLLSSALRAFLQIRPCQPATGLRRISSRRNVFCNLHGNGKCQKSRQRTQWYQLHEQVPSAEFI